MPRVNLAPEEEELGDVEEGEVFHLPLFRPKDLPPKTRGDCLEGGSNEVRPCEWITCKWWMYPLEEGAARCVLDVAEQGGLTLEEVGNLLGITRERVRQVEETALRKIKMIDRNIINRSALRELSERDLGGPRGWNW